MWNKQLIKALSVSKLSVNENPWVFLCRTYHLHAEALLNNQNIFTGNPKFVRNHLHFIPNKYLTKYVEVLILRI